MLFQNTLIKTFKRIFYIWIFDFELMEHIYLIKLKQDNVVLVVEKDIKKNNKSFNSSWNVIHSRLWRENEQIWTTNWKVNKFTICHC